MADNEDENSSENSEIEEDFDKHTSQKEGALDSESEDEEIEKLKAELSTIPFCELQAIRDKIGVKKFNEAIHGSFKDDKKQMKQTSLKRKNKNRPREMSSKKPVPRFKQVVPGAKKVSRDPRFDDLSGYYNEHMFDKAYSFLNNIRGKEKQEIQKALKKEKDKEKKQELQSLAQRMDQAEKARNVQKLQKEKQRARKKEEIALIKQGKKPFYLKKSEKRKLELAEKYKTLKDSKKLDTYLKKRRKKNATKERKHLPEERT